MRELLIKYAKFNKEKYDYLIESSKRLTPHQTNLMEIFLLNFRNNYYSELHRIYRLPLDNSPNGSELWDRYFDGRKFHLVEMQMFLKWARVCREAWKDRPKFRSKKIKENDLSIKDSLESGN